MTVCDGALHNITQMPLKRPANAGTAETAQAEARDDDTADTGEVAFSFLCSLLLFFSSFLVCVLSKRS